MSFVRLPSDNTLVDDKGRFLPQWRPIFEAASRLSALTSQQQETLIALINAMTSGDNPVTLNEDGTISVDQQDVGASAIAGFNAGNIVGVQSAVSGAIPLNALAGLRFEQGASSLDMAAVPFGVYPPVSGGRIGPLGSYYDATAPMTPQQNRIFALPFAVWKRRTFTTIGPIAATNAGVSGNVGIYADNDGPGKNIYSGSFTSITSRNPAISGISLTLDPGLYWQEFQYLTTVVNTFMQQSANALSGPMGYVLAAGTDWRPISGIYRDPGSAGLPADETGSVWTPNYNGGVPFPFMVM